MKYKGFTLIEILIVLIVIGILATLMIPQMNKIVERTRKSEAMTNLSAIYSGLQVYQMEHDGSYVACADHAAIDTNLGVEVGDRFFNYSTADTGIATATRTGGTYDGHTIQRNAEDGTYRASASNPWGISTSWE